MNELPIVEFAIPILAGPAADPDDLASENFQAAVEWFYRTDPDAPGPDATDAELGEYDEGLYEWIEQNLANWPDCENPLYRQCVMTDDDFTALNWRTIDMIIHDAQAKYYAKTGFASELDRKHFANRPAAEVDQYRHCVEACYGFRR